MQNYLIIRSGKIIDIISKCDSIDELMAINKDVTVDIDNYQFGCLTKNDLKDDCRFDVIVVDSTKKHIIGQFIDGFNFNSLNQGNPGQIKI